MKSIQWSPPVASPKNPLQIWAQNWW